MTPEKRTDPTDGGVYTKAEFDTEHGGTSDSRWAAQAGNHETCWDSTYSYAGCCTPLDGTGVASCFADGACADDSAADADGAGNACAYYQGYGCEAGVLAGGATVTSDELKALCPLSCGICSGEHRLTGGYVGGTCQWDATYRFLECCASSAFTNAAGTSCAFGGKSHIPLQESQAT